MVTPMNTEDLAIELAIIEREAYARIAAKRTTEQKGEAFVGLEQESK